MNKILGLFAASMMLSCGGAMMAQNTPSEMTGPPKVLVIQREFLKPGKGGAMHEKSEAAFVNAFAGAKWPTHYFAAESLSGKPRVLFFVGYPSFEAWEKDNHDIKKNAVLASAIDRAEVADGELLTDFTQGVFLLDSDNSLRVAGGDIAHMRYFEISSIRVKPGHRAEFRELVKMYHDGFEASVPTAHWALFQSQYGEDNGGLYLVISPMKSLAEDDAGMDDDKKFADYMGPEKMKKLAELTAACLDSSQTNLFEFNPNMSYPPDEWMKADAFWTPKKSAATAAKKSDTAAMKKPAAAGQ